MRLFRPLLRLRRVGASLAGRLRCVGRLGRPIVRLTGRGTTIRFVLIGFALFMAVGLAYSGFLAYNAYNSLGRYIVQMHVSDRQGQPASRDLSAGTAVTTKEVTTRPSQILDKGAQVQAKASQPAPERKVSDKKVPGTRTDSEGTGVRHPLMIRRPVEGKTLVGFGWVYWDALGEWRFHPGMDIGAAEGQPVLAISDGVVASISTLPGIGRAVTIVHDEKIKSVYAPLTNLQARTGSKVRGGEVIGHIEAPGFIEGEAGTHLHFEVRKDGEAVDPASFWGGSSSG